jgi:hypothetical protein
MAKLLSAGWGDVFRASLTGEWTPAHLGIEQLIKHALALTTHAGGREPHLAYCYWEPVNGEQIPEVLAHRQELDTLRTRVGTAMPYLHVVSYQQLLAEWDDLPAPPPWLSAHLVHLHERYTLHI